jgi:hypothetical protein
MASKYWEDQIQATRDRYTQRGDQLYDNLGQTIGGYRDRENDDRTNAYGALNDLRQTPGYTDQEATDIRGQAGLDALGNADYGSNYLTGDEQSAITGDPYKALSAYNPQKLDDQQQQNSNTVLNTIDSGRGQLRDDYNQMAYKMEDAARNPELQQSGSYRQGQSQILDDTAGGMRGAVDRSKLGVSGEYDQNYNWTGKDSADLETAAGRTVGMKAQSDDDRMAREAAADGNTSPAALAAMRERNDINAAAEAGDSMTDARIKAKQMGLGVAQQREDTRLGAERDISGRQTQNARDLGTMALGQNSEREQMRLGANQDISSREMQAAGTEGAAAQQIGEYGTSTAANAAEQLGSRGLGIEQWQQGQTAATLQAGEQAEANRAATVAGNRQSVNLSNQANQFNRGFQVNQADSQRAENVANARRQGNQQYLQGVTGQQQMSQGGGLTTQQQQIGQYGTQYGQANQANNTAANYSMWQQGQPGVVSQIASGVLGAAAAFEDGGFVGDTSEDGVPINEGMSGGEPGDSGHETSNFWDKLRSSVGRYRQLGGPISGGGSGQQQGGSGQGKLQQDYQLGQMAGTAAKNVANLFAGSADAFADGGAPRGTIGMVGERGPEIVMDPKHPENSQVVSKPTIAMLGNKGREMVIPLNPGRNAKLRPSMALPALSRYRKAAASPQTTRPIAPMRPALA